MSPHPSNREAADEVERVLSSSTFGKATLQAKLLRHICSEYLAGRADQIKEYRLATEVLGRPPDFDQSRDSIVRVEAHRLRKKLKEYYEGEGASHPLRIVIDPGRYVPRFVPREEYVQHGTETDNENRSLTEAKQDKFPKGRSPAALAKSTVISHRGRTLLLAGITIAVVAIFVLFEWGERPAPSVGAVPQPESVPTSDAPPAVVARDSVRILAGFLHGDHTDPMGKVWGADQYFSGGEVVQEPRHFVARTMDSFLYEHWRQGEFTYDIPLKPGEYELHLYFAEPEFGPEKMHGGGESSRVFNVVLNGKPLLYQFDIMRDAGANDKADERIFTGLRPASDGFLHLAFVKQTDYPLVNAIEVIPGLPGKMHPIRIIASINSYTDHQGKAWSPDRYFEGGRLNRHNVVIENSPDADLYTNERFGTFNYAIPVAPNDRYVARLHFAETFFGPQNSGGGGEGSRVFDVYCNGTALLRRFDIYKEAGGENRALVKTFHNLLPNAQGKLVFTFVPIANYACINAIEVAPE